MTTSSHLAAAGLLVRLNRLGVCARLRGDRIALRPGTRVPSQLLAEVRDSRPALIDLLNEPRRRWRGQARALLSGMADGRRAAMLELFDEREAIASVDGGADDDSAGRLAYQTLADIVLREDSGGLPGNPAARPPGRERM